MRLFSKSLWKSSSWQRAWSLTSRLISIINTSPAITNFYVTSLQQLSSKPKPSLLLRHLQASMEANNFSINVWNDSHITRTIITPSGTFGLLSTSRNLNSSQIPLWFRTNNVRMEGQTEKRRDTSSRNWFADTLFSLTAISSRKCGTIRHDKYLVPRPLD